MCYILYVCTVCLFDHSNTCDETLVLQLKDEIDKLRGENDKLSHDANK